MTSSLAQFKQQLKPYKAIIGFDYGSKRLGIAVSDLLLTVATPYAIWQRSDFTKDLAYIQKVIAEKEVGAIVFGLPLQMNGEVLKSATEYADSLSGLSVNELLALTHCSRAKVEDFIDKIKQVTINS